MNKATIVRTDGTTKELDHKPTLEEAQKIVGGWIELVRAKDRDGKIVTLVVDEEGKIKRKVDNKIITEKYGASIYNGYIVGDAIVLEGWRTVAS